MFWASSLFIPVMIVTIFKLSHFLYSTHSTSEIGHFFSATVVAIYLIHRSQEDAIKLHNENK